MKKILAALLLAAASFGLWANSSEHGGERLADTAPPAPERQTLKEADAKSKGCMTCHTETDRHTMHANPAVILGCTDCHGGNVKIVKPQGAEYKGKHANQYVDAMNLAHVLPRFPSKWHTPSSANPQGSFALLNQESPAFIRFMNPSDYRVARNACGACHLTVIQAAERSIMSTGAMLWNGAAYNNGILPFKFGLLGEAYTPDGIGASIKTPYPANMTPKEIADLAAKKGVIPQIFPLPAWETIPPADIFRVFERGGRVISSQFPEIGLPNNSGRLQALDEPGRPDIKQSNRGPGTGSRIAVPVINITKTRLNDPFMWFLGTNDNPGDYRSSGCAGCHVIYANDRQEFHSGPYAKFGNEGMTITKDPTIPKHESGHPLKHEFTRSIPSAQCMNCHMHQPNVFVNTFYGYTMWDYESDAPFMWPEKQHYPSDEERRKVYDRNPEGAAARGKWRDPEFLKNVFDLNPKLKDTQFADYHGHGWNFRAIFKRDRKGNLLDKDNKLVSDEDPQKFNKAVHLQSVHVDVGMHCVDCHFSQDSHGNGLIYFQVADAVEITCEDCHGTVDKYPTLFTTGPAARPGGTDLSLMRTPDGRKRFEWRNGKLYQRSTLYPDKEWEMSLVKDTVNPKHPKYNAKAAQAKLVADGDFDNYQQTWDLSVPPEKRAHSEKRMLCQSCHTSWTTSCAGCHLPIEANEKTERHHYEGGETRNYATYNPQVARDDMFHLGKHGPSKDYKIAPVRSSSALVLSSTNINREHIYVQQPPTAGSGYSSQAFAPHYPHTERKTETKTCDDCHLSPKNDNNAIVAQTLIQGTGFVGFVGYTSYVGETGNVEGVRVTEWEEPQAVIGSYLHRYAYPDWYKQHQDRGRELPEAHDHTTAGEATCIQHRGEYLYVAEGKGGFRVYDIASIANKGVSQRIVTAPFSDLGHDTHIASKNATCMALATTQPVAPFKNKGFQIVKDPQKDPLHTCSNDKPTLSPLCLNNQEQPMHPIYSYAVITDAEEGLILTDINTLQDGDPQNNYLKRALTWNEKGILTGARHVTLGGYYAYISTDKGLVILNLDNPLKPVVTKFIPLKGARASALQFRYLTVLADDGMHVVDVTLPERAKLVEGAFIPFKDAHRIYLARTYAYVAAGSEGLVIVDIENPEKPKIYQRYTADGALNDARDVVVASTNASLFAYVADGKNGLKVLQLTSPEIQPKFYGFSPDPKPHLIATRKTQSPALSLSRALERDRAVDETGNQVAVFGRVGSRPFNLEEQRKLYLKPDGTPWTAKMPPSNTVKP